MHRPEPVKCLHRQGVLFREGCLLLLLFPVYHWFGYNTQTILFSVFFPTTHGNIVCSNVRLLIYSVLSFDLSFNATVSEKVHSLRFFFFNLGCLLFDRLKKIKTLLPLPNHLAIGLHLSFRLNYTVKRVEHTYSYLNVYLQRLDWKN